MSAFDSLDEQETRAAYELAARGTRSLEEVAEAVGISRRSLTRFRKRPQVKRAIREIVQDEIDESLPEVMAAMKKQAMKGNVKAQEAFAKMAGFMVERHQVHQHTTTEVNGGRYAELSSTQIDEELAALGVNSPQMVDEQ